MTRSPKLAALVSIAGILLPILSGCAVGPDYAPPDLAVPETWNSQLEEEPGLKKTSRETLADWWTTFDDPILSRLVECAIAGNLDLQKALAQVREARARRGEAEAELFPTLDADGSAVWSRSEALQGGSTTTGELYQAGFDAGWELDVFGGKRRSLEAAGADLDASVEEQRDVLVSLLAEVALNYIEVRTYQTRLAVAEDNLRTQEETYRLASWRQEAGLSDELAAQQARYNLENTRSQIPALRAAAAAAMNRLAVLLGEPPGSLEKELRESGPIPSAPLAVVVGIPADTLRRRPDVRQAERQLAAQTARVGEATAELYPKFNLSGSIGLETLSLSHPSSSGIVSLTGGPIVSWPIFRAGAIRQNIAVQEAIQEQYLIAYESVVLDALEEVENALTNWVEEQERRDSLDKATKAAQIAAELARHKYQAGLTDFDNVLEAQRSLLSFQEQLAQSNGTVASNLVRLYKVLGGGWTPLNVDDPSRTNPQEE